MLPLVAQHVEELWTSRYLELTSETLLQSPTILDCNSAVGVSHPCCLAVGMDRSVMCWGLLGLTNKVLNKRSVSVTKIPRTCLDLEFLLIPLWILKSLQISETCSRSSLVRALHVAVGGTETCGR